MKQCHHYWPDEGSDVYHIYEVIEKEVKQKGHERHVFLLQLGTHGSSKRQPSYVANQVAVCDSSPDEAGVSTLYEE